MDTGGPCVLIAAVVSIDCPSWRLLLLTIAAVTYSKQLPIQPQWAAVASPTCNMPPLRTTLLVLLAAAAAAYAPPQTNAAAKRCLREDLNTEKSDGHVQSEPQKERCHEQHQVPNLIPLESSWADVGRHCGRATVDLQNSTIRRAHAPSTHQQRQRQQIPRLLRSTLPHSVKYKQLNMRC